VERYEVVGDVRVRGCFAAIELVRDRASKERHTGLQHALAQAMLRRGVFADSSTTSLNLQPSLAMAEDDLERVLGLVLEALEEVAVGA
jgi:4-aminobutyrate aminotransferase/(S)-3-amino-2-methylpropionate transaminase